MNRKAALVLAMAALAGCATTRDVRVRDLPDDRPAASRAAAIERAQQLAALAAAREAEAPVAGDAPAALAPPVTPADAPSMVTYDPFERINRFTYRFNARFDESVFLPVANGYRRLPRPVRSGVHNFFGNLGEIGNTLNFALQGRPGYGLRSLGRFAINTTIGIGGLFDVAKKMKLPPAATGFGTTLAKWGMRPGPYLVLPLIGPSTLRDTVGLGGDFGISYAADPGGFYRTSQNAWMFGVANSVDLRAHIDFRYYETGSAFEYDTIRFLYVRQRLLEDEKLRAEGANLPRSTDAPAGQ